MTRLRLSVALVVVVLLVSGVAWAQAPTQTPQERPTASRGTPETPSVTVTCILRHSAVAELDDDGKIDVHTSADDSITATLTGLGQETAVFNGSYSLVRLKEDRHAYYYVQPSDEGVSMWVYFKLSRTLTYAKLRAFPLTGAPSSYLMIGYCE